MRIKWLIHIIFLTDSVMFYTFSGCLPLHMATIFTPQYNVAVYLINKISVCVIFSSSSSSPKHTLLTSNVSIENHTNANALNLCVRVNRMFCKLLNIYKFVYVYFRNSKKNSLKREHDSECILGNLI